MVMDLEDLKRKFRLNISFRDLVLEHSVKSKFPRVIFKAFYLITYHMDTFYDIEKNSIKSKKDLLYNTYIHIQSDAHSSIRTYYISVMSL